MTGIAGGLRFALVGASDPVKHVPPKDRVAADPTPGVHRERAIAVEGLWAGVARTDPATASGWHHHGEYETSIYVVSGRLRMESGPGGREVIDAVAGDFLYVPPGAVHRESNPGDSESSIVVARAGHGPPTVNVEGPA
ncbi:MAG TPA: cupin domain-containing protein [Acidimicrobiales bacterium]|nr:cupin domain-containing protein [Acidimicrobiales bacterium]